MRLGWTGGVALLMLAGPALAHPHVFISTAVEVVVDTDGRATSLRIRWTYDEFFSLMILQDRGMDADFDGILQPAEVAALTGFDMAWEAGFEGDTHALLDEAPLGLGGPTGFAVSYADGMLTTVHERAFDTPPDLSTGQSLVIMAYDPGYYTAYSMDTAPTVTGAAHCTAATFAPDPAQADAMLEQMLQEYSGDDLEAGGFPAVGAAYADEVRVTCAARS